MRLGAIIALVLVAAAPAAATAGNTSAIAATFGNTVHITSDTDNLYIYFNADGTFTTSGTDGQQIGTWKIEGGKICTKIKDQTSCGLVEAGRQVGDEWQHTLDGQTVTIRIEKGR